MDTKPNKAIMRRLGFLPQAKPTYNVKYEVFADCLLCSTTCPNCLTKIDFKINGQTKGWTERYISDSVAAALNRNHTHKCKARLAEYNDVANRKTFIGDLLRGAEQSQERAYRVLTGKEAPVHKA